MRMDLITKLSYDPWEFDYMDSLAREYMLSRQWKHRSSVVRVLKVKAWASLMRRESEIPS